MRKIAKKDVTVNTREYRFSHGREPKGRGCWAFSEKRDPDFGSNSRDIKFYTGTYAEAKRQAVAEAAENGVNRIFVQP